jgi:hypothetical protein
MSDDLQKKAEDWANAASTDMPEGGYSWHMVRDAYLAGARWLLEQAKKEKFDVINDESPVVLVSYLESLFEGKK